jgi:3-oxosteroid 1-dehydrogenase
MNASSGSWQHSADLVIVGSGGGSMCAALVARSLGLEPLILEKTDKVGGSTAMSGGILWIPDNPVMKRAGVDDSYERARTYLDSVVGDAGPASSPQRREAYLRTGPRMIEFLEQQGIKFSYCDGWSDYYDDYPGGEPRGRSLQGELFDARELGEWNAKLRRSPMPAIPLAYPEFVQLDLMKRTGKGVRALLLLIVRSIGQALKRTTLLNVGMAIQGRMLQASLRNNVPIWTDTGVEELLTENGRVVGVRVRRDGKLLDVQARAGVLLNSGGFSHNKTMRERYQPKPSSTQWTNANPGDTGEVIEQAQRLGAAIDLMNESWWVPTSLPPDGQRFMHVSNLPKPHCIVVDSQGKRFVDESVSYMEFGQTLYRHGLPAWAILDARHRKNYFWGTTAAGITPKEWLTSGYIKKAQTLDELAALCHIDANGLRETVERFNGFARNGRDEDFNRGGRAYGRHFGDPRNQPNPSLGTIERGPFYAVQIVPGDVGTAGGVLTDEHARVLRTDGSVIDGLYATGNCTASVMGRTYPAAGASIGASFVFGYIAARHALQQPTSKPQSNEALAANAAPGG